MTQQIIDIGIQGNDGTGDSIRESFNKVNANFNELYAVFGLGGSIAFSDLADAPGTASYTVTSAVATGSQVTLNFSNPNAGLGSPFSSGEAIVIKQVVPSGYNGTYTVTSTTPTSVTFASTTTGAITTTGKISGKSYQANQVIMSSTTGTFLTSRNLVAGTNISIDTSNNKQLVINSNTAGLISDPQPSLGSPMNADLLTIGRLGDPSEDLVNTFNAVYANQGITTTLGQLAVTVNYANNNFLQVTDGQVVGPLRVRSEPTTPQTTDPDYNASLSGNYVATEAIQRQHAVLRDGDKMAGPLTLSDHPAPMAGFGTPNGSDDLQAATKFYVDNNTHYSNTNLYVSTSGDDTQAKTPAGREGRAWQYAYKTVGAAALQAENLINLAFTEPGPYRQTIAYTIGPTQYQSTIQSISFSGGNIGIQGYEDAASLLEANKAFIQAETIAYLNNKYVNSFTFDHTRYTNIIENIVKGVGYDLVVGSNFNSTTQASILFDAYNSDVSANLTTILAAINYAAEQITNYSYNSDNLNTYLTNVITAVCYDLEFGSNYRSIQAAIGFNYANTGLETTAVPINTAVTSTSGDASGTACAITGTTLVVSGTVTGVWAVGMTLTGFGVTAGTYITALGTGSGGAGSYTVNISQTVTTTSITGANNLVICQSTTGMVVGNIVTFSGTSFGNIIAGNIYYITSINSALNSFTISKTLGGDNVGLTTATGTLEASTTGLSAIAGVLSNLANDIISLTALAPYPTVAAQITTIINNISNIIETGVIPTPVFPPVSSNVDSTGQQSAVNLLINNIKFIQAEIVAFLLANYPTLTYNKVTCERDIEYIIWALSYDIMYGGNSQSIYAGLQYWINSKFQIQSYEQTATVAAIGYAGTLAETIVVNIAPATLYQTGVIQYANTTLSGGSVAINSINTNIGSIQAIVNSASEPSPSVTLPTTTLVPIEIGTIVSAITADITTLQTNAGTYITSNYPVINVSGEQTSISNLFNVITSLLKGGINSRSTPTYTAPSGLAASAVNATAAILDNFGFITAEVNAYITANYPSVSYDTSKSIRDFTYILEAIVYDLTYGGTSATVQAANQYYVNGLSQLTSDNKAACLAGITHGLNTVQSIIANSTVVPSAGNYITVTGSSGSGTIATLTFNTQSVAPYSVGQIITIQGMTPTGYNGYYTVTACNTTSVSFANTTTGNTGFVAGKITSQVQNSSWGGVNSGAGQSTVVTSLFGIVTGVISNQVLATGSYPSIIGYSGNLQIAFNIIENNAYTIALNTVKYLASTFAGGFSYNEATCYRDIGYIIDGQVIDLISDGTYQSVTAGKSYYKNVAAKSIAIGTQYAETTDGISFAQQLAVQVLEQTTQSRYQTLITQKTNATLGTNYNATVGTNVVTASYVSNTTTTLTITSLSGTLVPGMVITGAGFTSGQTIVSVNSIGNVTLSAAPNSTPSGVLTFTATPVTTLNANMNTVLNIINNGVGAAPTPSFGGGYYTLTFGNGGNGYVDQGEPGDTHILPAMVLVGDSGGAYGQIISYTPGVSTNYDTITLSMTRPGFFQYVPTTASGTNGSYSITVANTSYTAPYLGTTNIVVGMGVIGNNINFGTTVTAVNGNVVTLSQPLTGTISSVNVTFGEQLDFGSTVADQNITIYVESGIYYEDYPIKLPANCTIRGDDFRRTIIRPLNRISQSPWRTMFFYRDSVIDGLQTGLIDFSGTDYAAVANTTATVSATTGNIQITLGSGTASPNWIGYVFCDQNSETGTTGKAVVNTVSGNIMNCTVIYPFATVKTYTSGQWHLYDTINYGRHYLTNPLDITSTPKNNKNIDVFLCNDATRVKLITCQGHGGFMMVLDPEGQIKTKSPYGQESASFSGSINRQQFAGGQFIDGFAGRLFGTITGIGNSGYTLTVTGTTNSGLDVRAPQTPTAFYTQGNRYQINDVLSYNQNTATVVLQLDSSTPFLPASVYSDSTLSTNIASAIQAVGYDMAICSSATMSASSISGNTLTVGTVSGTIFVGMYLTGIGITVGSVYITANISGTGAGSTWQLNTNLNINSETITGTLFSNYQSAKTGLYYTQPANSVTALSQEIVTQAVTYAGQQILALSLTSLDSVAVNANIAIINNIINNAISGASTESTAVPTLQFPIPSGKTITSDVYLAAMILQANRTFIQNEISAFIAGSTNTGALVGYSALKSQRDIGYIVDALTYDLLYGGNSSIYDIASSYYVNGVSQLGTNLSTCIASFARLSYILPNIIANTAITVSTGNTILQNRSLSTPVTPATQCSVLTTLVTVLSNSVATSTGINSYTRTLPTITNSDLTKITGAVSSIQNATINYINNGGGIGINLETAGNKSMLANDFTQINDLGYGILCTNAGLTEQVSTFTYYCYTAYWSLNGGQIRSVAGSNSNGVYGLRSTGSDVTELPNAVNLQYDMVQSARIYKQGAYATTMTPTATTQALSVYIIGWEYLPFDISELEIDHTLEGGGITRYEISTASHTNVDINGQNVLQLTLSSSGADNTSTTGLQYPLYDGQVVTIRVLQNIKFYNISNVKPVRPSTALQYTNNLSSIYRIIAYNLTESTGETLPAHVAILQMDTSFQYYLFVVDNTNMFNADPTVTVATANVAITPVSTGNTLYVVTSSISGSISAGQVIGGYGFAGQKVVSTSVSGSNTVITFSGNILNISPVGSVYFSNYTQGGNLGDNKIAILQISSTSLISQINTGIYVFGWNGRTHRIIKYVAPVFVASGTYLSSGSSGTTLIVQGVAGTISPGQYVTGTGFNGTQIVSSVTTVVLTGTAIIQSTVILNVAPSSTPSGIITFGGANVNGYLQIDPNPVDNIGASGTGVTAMTYVSNTLVTGSTTSKLITFNIPYNTLLSYPPVDSYITVSGNSNTNYNGSYQVAAIGNTTQFTVASTTNLQVGMVITTSASGAFIPSPVTNPSGLTIIQSIDSATQFTVNPACWVPAGTSINAQIIATVQSITITNLGSGYTSAPTITFSGGGAITQALAVCTIVDGSINSVTLVSPGYGYTSTPTIVLSGNSGTVTQTATGTNLITLNSSANLSVGETITFSGTPFGGLSVGVPYYIYSITGNQITVSASSLLTSQFVITANANGANLSWSCPGNGVLTPILTSNPLVVTTVSSGVNNLQATLVYPTDPGTSGNVTSTAVTAVSTDATSSINSSGVLTIGTVSGASIATGMVLTGTGVAQLGSYTITNVSGTGSTATITVVSSATNPFAVGQVISVTNIVPTAYDGSYVVTASGTYSFSNTAGFISGTTLSLPGTTTGTVAVGAVITGSNISVSNTYITSANIASFTGTLGGGSLSGVAITNNAGSFSCASAGGTLSIGQQITISGTITNTATNLTTVYATSVAGAYSCASTSLAVGQPVAVSGTTSNTALTSIAINPNGVFTCATAGVTLQVGQLIAISGTISNSSTPLTTVNATGIAGQYSCASTTLYVGQSVTISGTTSNTNLSGVVIGTAGTFTCSTAGVTLQAGQQITISGTNTGSGVISGYTAPGPQTYYIIGSPTQTSFTLSASYNGSAIGTSPGTPTGLTFAVVASAVTGYSNPTTYLIGATNGSTTFTLTTTVGSAIVTTVGAVTGQTFTVLAPAISGYSNPTSYYVTATNGSTTFTLSTTSGGPAITTTGGVPTGLTVNAVASAITGYSNPTTYYITSTNGSTTFTLATTYGGVTPVTTTIGATTGLTFAVQPPSISGYSNPTTYLISATNGSTTFTLQTLASAPITTVVGTPTGLTFSDSTNALNVTGITSGTVSVGMVITGSGVTPGTYITALGSGSGGVGSYTINQFASGTPTTGTSYTVNNSQTASSGAISGISTQVSYASSATGAVGFVSGSGTLTSNVYTYITSNISGSGNGSTWQTVTSQGTNFAVSSTSITATNNLVTVNTVSNLSVGDPIKFSGTTFGGISTTTQYYITEIIGSTLSISPGNPGVNTSLVAGSGTLLSFYSPAYGYGSTMSITGATNNGVVGGVGTYATYYSITFNINTQSVAPATGAYYYVTGNANTLFNGYNYCGASTTSSITLYYPYNPGTFGLGTTTITKEVTSASSNSLGISKPFNPNISTSLRAGYPANGGGQITVRISTTRATGHDFLDIGTGGFITSNYPNQIYGNAAIAANQTQQVLEETVGRCFYVSTDENGIFKVGRFFQVDQGTGTVTFSASIALSNLDGLGFKRGVVVSEFSTDPNMTENAADTVPVQSAIRSFIDYRLGLDYSGNPVATSSLIGPGYLALNGTLAMKGNLNMSSYSISNLVMPASGTTQFDGANRGYVDANLAGVSSLYKLNDVSTKVTATYVGLGVSGGGPVVYTMTLSNVYGTIQPGMIITGTGFVSGQTVLTVNITAGTPATGGSGTITISGNYDTTPSGTLTFTTLTNGNFLVYDNTLSQWTNIAPPTGTGNSNQVSITYTHGTPGYLKATIQSSVIVDSMVSSSAAIQQSKLSLQAANAALSTAPVSFTQSSLGVATFNSNAFTLTNGWVDLQTSTSASTGVLLTKLQQIGTGYVLGNFGTGAASPLQVSAGAVVTNGDGIKNSSFSTPNTVTSNASSQAMLVLYNGTSTSSNTYGVIGVTTNSTASSLVKTGSDGSVTAQQLNIGTSGGAKAISVSGSTLSFWTPGQFAFLTSADNSGSATTTLSGSVVVPGTLFTTTIETGANVSTAGQMTGQWSLGSLSSFNFSSGTLQTNNITTGSNSTVGILTGKWQMASGSTFDGTISLNTAATLDTTNGTLLATTLSTGSSSTAGSIIGTWTIATNSQLQATYADLAEYYEGDQEYEAGTVLVFGGDKEVTTTTIINDTRSAGVVTTNPAYVMNAEQTGIKVCIALAGRVPVKVVGRVKKGDMLTTSATPGYAVRALNPTLGAVIGKALEDKDYGEAGVIQVAVGRV